MRHTERDLEKRCVAMARREGWTCWKNEKNGNTGIPDFSMLSPKGRFVLIEFKRPDGGGVMSRQQQAWRERFPDIVHVVDSVEGFIDIIYKECDGP